jgi:dihydroxy-acid dehydratase
MDPASKKVATAPGDAKYINFPRLPDNATRDGKPVLNKYSSFITKDHDFPGAQVDTSYLIASRPFYSFVHH